MPVAALLLILVWSILFYMIGRSLRLGCNVAELDDAVPIQSVATGAIASHFGTVPSNPRAPNELT